MYGTTPQAKQYYGVSSDTLRRWAKNGKIQFQTTKGGHRRYFIPDKKVEDGKKRIIYARVSSNKQEHDLQNQIKYLSQKYPDYETVHDIGSGINFNRKGFNSILEHLFDGDIEEVVVATKDRFSRFGFELFQSIFDRFKATLTVVDEDKEKSDEEELAEDLLSIITIFTARYHGKRKYTRKIDQQPVKQEKSKTVKVRKNK